MPVVRTSDECVTLDVLLSDKHVHKFCIVTSGFGVNSAQRPLRTLET